MNQSPVCLVILIRCRFFDDSHCIFLCLRKQPNEHVCWILFSSVIDHECPFLNAFRCFLTTVSSRNFLDKKRNVLIFVGCSDNRKLRLCTLLSFLESWNPTVRADGWEDIKCFSFRASTSSFPVFSAHESESLPCTLDCIAFVWCLNCFVLSSDGIFRILTSYSECLWRRPCGLALSLEDSRATKEGAALERKHESVNIMSSKLWKSMSLFDQQQSCTCEVYFRCQPWQRPVLGVVFINFDLGMWRVNMF